MFIPGRALLAVCRSVSPSCHWVWGSSHIFVLPTCCSARRTSESARQRFTEVKSSSTSAKQEARDRIVSCFTAVMSLCDCRTEFTQTFEMSQGVKGKLEMLAQIDFLNVRKTLQSCRDQRKSLSSLVIYFKLSCVTGLQMIQFSSPSDNWLEQDKRMHTSIHQPQLQLGYIFKHNNNILAYFHHVHILVHIWDSVISMLTSEPRWWLEVFQLLLPRVFQVLSQHNILVLVILLVIRVVVVRLPATYPLSVLQQPQLMVRQHASL